MCILTDASAEGVEVRDSVTIGGMLFGSGITTGRFFSAKVPEDVVATWMELGRTQPINQAETYAVLVAKRTWGSHLQDANVLYGVDNRSAMDTLIRCNGREQEMKKLAMCCSIADVKLRSRPWYFWVPSFSNLADQPSRGKRDELEKKGWKEVFPSLPNAVDLEETWATMVARP